MSPNGWDSTIDLSGIAAHIQAAAVRGVQLGGEHVLSESTKRVPIEEGTLSRSGIATAEARPGEAVGAVSYDTPYAVRQHEEMDYRHDEGRTAKYLEGPLVEEASTVAAIAAEQVRQALR